MRGIASAGCGNLRRTLTAGEGGQDRTTALLGAGIGRRSCRLAGCRCVSARLADYVGVVIAVRHDVPFFARPRLNLDISLCNLPFLSSRRLLVFRDAQHVADHLLFFLFRCLLCLLFLPLT